MVVLIKKTLLFVIIILRYSWSSERLINDTPPPKQYTLEHLIPLENPELNGKGIKIVIGHHVGYDRARVREQYIATVKFFLS